MSPTERSGPRGEVSERADPIPVEATKDRLPQLVFVLTIVLELAWISALIFGVVWLVRLVVG